MRFWPLQRSLALLRCPQTPSRGRSRYGVVLRPCGVSLSALYRHLSCPAVSVVTAAGGGIAPFGLASHSSLRFIFGRDVPDSLHGLHRAWSGVRVRSPTTLMGFLPFAVFIRLASIRLSSGSTHLPLAKASPRIELFSAEAPAGPVLLFSDRPAGHGLCTPGFWVFPQVSGLAGLSRPDATALGFAPLPGLQADT